MPSKVSTGVSSVAARSALSPLSTPSTAPSSPALPLFELLTTATSPFKSLTASPSHQPGKSHGGLMDPFSSTYFLLMLVVEIARSSSIHAIISWSERTWSEESGIQNGDDAKTPIRLSCIYLS